MKQIMRVLWLALLAGMSNQAFAIEASANGGPQAAQAAVTSMNNTVNASLSALQQQISGTLACNRLRKFYVPGDPKADSSSCVGIGDYQLTMNNTSGVNTTNSSLTATNTNTANTYAGYFQNMTAHGSGLYGYSNGDGYGLFGDAEQAGGVGVRGVGGSEGVFGSTSGGIGVYGTSTSQQGVYGASSSNWGGYFTGTYGVYGQSTSTWAGEFYGVGSGTGSVYIGNAYNNAQLCLNGACTTSLPGAGGHQFGGIFVRQWAASGGGTVYCATANGFTGACVCPAGFNQYEGTDTTNGGYWDLRLEWCIS